jgi:hypothetical protein
LKRAHALTFAHDHRRDPQHFVPVTFVHSRSGVGRRCVSRSRLRRARDDDVERHHPQADARDRDRRSPAATSALGVYAVTFGVRSGGGRLGAIQFEARPRHSGRWQGRGAKVACANITGAAMHACNEKSNGVLTCGLIDTNGIPASSDLVRCVFESDTPVSASDFSVRVVDASNTATKPVHAEVLVTRVKAR